MQNFENCLWWRDQYGLKTALYPGQDGECRRNAPMMPLIVSTNEHFKVHGMWPTTRSTDGCGEWRARPEVSETQGGV